MDKLTRFCKTCGENKKIVLVETSPEMNTVKMSCGHSDINICVSDTIHLFEQVEEEVKTQGKTVGKGKQRSKISGTTKRLTRESLSFDWVTRTKHHIVEEQQDDATWAVVHEHTDPFGKKKPN